jgi:small subunit ribosomal protein S8
MDPVSDFFIRIKNAQKAGHDNVRVPFSKFKYEIVKVLERAGFVRGIERRGRNQAKRMLDIGLPSSDEGGGMRGVKFFSTPGKRAYGSYRGFGRAARGGIVVVSTPKGVVEAREARKAKVGGQLIAEVW